MRATTRAWRCGRRGAGAAGAACAGLCSQCAAARGPQGGDASEDLEGEESEAEETEEGGEVEEDDECETPAAARARLQTEVRGAGRGVRAPPFPPLSSPISAARLTAWRRCCAPPHGGQVAACVAAFRGKYGEAVDALAASLAAAAPTLVAVTNGSVA
jgi:hypothetical protein